jgi:probable HAF family extracellular repeat protein
MHRSIYCTVLLSALFAMSLGGTASHAFAAASLTPLGDLPGGDFFNIAEAVSADGSTVVGFSSSTFNNEAFRWTASSGMVGLGGLMYDGSGESGAAGVSDDGSIVVVGGVLAGGLGESFRWTAASGMVSLGYFPGDQRNTSGAGGVNADGSVVVGGGVSFSGGAAHTEAFRWTAASGMVGLGDLPGGIFSSYATDVSADGSAIVGYSSSGNGFSEAFRWTAASGIVGLGDLPGGGFFSEAKGISADGSIVVGQSRIPVFGNSDLEAFRWTASAGMVGLGDLPGGDFYSDALDVSADGSTIVGEGNSDSGRQAVRWTSAGGIESLWDVLLAHGIDPAADGWTHLIRATGVSANGNTIVGFGARNGNTESFIAVVPEPTGLRLIGLAVLALLRRRQRVNNAMVK